MFELFEHTADLGLRIRARDLPALFRDAGRCLFAAIAEPEPTGAAARQVSFELQGDRYDYLMLDWLAELLFVSETEHVLLGEFRVAVDDYRVVAQASVYDPRGYRLLREVKAVTYHGLKVERLGGGWLAEIIVDI
jgi:SHS2 domain-containing protein